MDLFQTLIIWNLFSEQAVIFRNACYRFAHETWCVRCGSISGYVSGYVNGICQFCRWIGKFSTGSRDDSRGRVNSPSWQLTLHGHSSDEWPTCELLAGELRICSSLKWIVLVLENQESNACNKSPVYQHPFFVTRHILSKTRSLLRDTFSENETRALLRDTFFVNKTRSLLGDTFFITRHVLWKRDTCFVTRHVLCKQDTFFFRRHGDTLFENDKNQSSIRSSDNLEIEWRSRDRDRVTI